MQETWLLFSNESHSQAHEPCACLPLAPLQRPGSHPVRQEEFIPVAPALGLLLNSSLTGFFPRTLPFSLLLLHIAQFKHIHISPTSPIICQRASYHAPFYLQEQLLSNVRRALRANDQILVDKQGRGAIFLFPQVDREGITRIAERISRSINLLQAETIVPPLQYETEIVTGFASYPEPATSQEELLYQASQVQERITFRPAVVPRRQRTRAERSTDISRNPLSLEARMQEAQANGIPFMQIPSRLPVRLKQLIPYTLAQKLRCAPVGRNHNQLTVAMANPTDTQALYHLREATGMSIYPVSCEITALDTLLASDW